MAVLGEGFKPRTGRFWQCCCHAPASFSHTWTPTLCPIDLSNRSHLPPPGLPTRDLVFGRSDRGRPLLTGPVAAAASAVRLDLNVSHHGPLVVLAAVAADAQECEESGNDQGQWAMHNERPHQEREEKLKSRHNM